MHGACVQNVMESLITGLSAKNNCMLVYVEQAILCMKSLISHSYAVYKDILINNN
jgi:hypothetical protein